METSTWRYLISSDACSTQAFLARHGSHESRNTDNSSGEDAQALTWCYFIQTIVILLQQRRVSCVNPSPHHYTVWYRSARIISSVPRSISIRMTISTRPPSRELNYCGARGDNPSKLECVLCRRWTWRGCTAHGRNRAFGF